MTLLYDVDMTTERITITLQADVLAYAREQAEAAGLSLSAWLNRITEKDRKIRDGLAAMDEIWAEIGPPTPEEDVWAERMFQTFVQGADQETVDRVWNEFPEQAATAGESEVA
jgi:hypothetical protein